MTEKCKDCGRDFERWSIDINGQKYNSLICPECALKSVVE